MIHGFKSMSEVMTAVTFRLRKHGRGAGHVALIVAGLIAAAAVTGCGQGDEADYLEGLPHPRLVAQLEERAHDLAQRQYEYFKMYEDEHRDEVRYHEIVGHPFREGEGVYLKDYREFVGYTVDDILRSESYRTPVEMVITYYYEWRITPPRASDLGRVLLDLDPTLIAANDTEFSVRSNHRMTRRYRCDSQGDYHGALETPLPLEHYYLEVGEETDESPMFEFASEETE